jgi:ATP-dependent Lon protease
LLFLFNFQIYLQVYANPGEVYCFLEYILILMKPPGTGKESLAKACATKCTASFFFLTPEISQGTI